MGATLSSQSGALPGTATPVAVGPSAAPVDGTAPTAHDDAGAAAAAATEKRWATFALDGIFDDSWAQADLSENPATAIERGALALLASETLGDASASQYRAQLRTLAASLRSLRPEELSAAQQDLQALVAAQASSGTPASTSQLTILLQVLSRVLGVRAEVLTKQQAAGTVTLFAAPKDSGASMMVLTVMRLLIMYMQVSSSASPQVVSSFMEAMVPLLSDVPALAFRDAEFRLPAVVHDGLEPLVQWFSGLLRSSSGIEFTNVSTILLRLGLSTGSLRVLLVVLTAMLQAARDGTALVASPGLTAALAALARQECDFRLSALSHRASAVQVPPQVRNASPSPAAIASDGEYYYVHNGASLLKIGTGAQGSTAGKLYASRDGFHAGVRPWLAVVGSCLLYRSTASALTVMATSNLSALPMQVNADAVPAAGPADFVSPMVAAGKAVYIFRRVVAEEGPVRFVVDEFDATNIQNGLLPLKSTHDLPAAVGAAIVSPSIRVIYTNGYRVVFADQAGTFFALRVGAWTLENVPAAQAGLDLTNAAAAYDITTNSIVLLQPAAKLPVSVWRNAGLAPVGDSAEAAEDLPANVAILDHPAALATVPATPGTALDVAVALCAHIDRLGGNEGVESVADDGVVSLEEAMVLQVDGASMDLINSLLDSTLQGMSAANATATHHARWHYVHITVLRLLSAHLARIASSRNSLSRLGVHDAVAAAHAKVVDLITRGTAASKPAQDAAWHVTTAGFDPCMSLPSSSVLLRFALASHEPSGAAEQFLARLSSSVSACDAIIPEGANAGTGLLAELLSSLANQAIVGIEAAANQRDVSPISAKLQQVVLGVQSSLMVRAWVAATKQQADAAGLTLDTPQRYTTLLASLVERILDAVLHTTFASNAVRINVALVLRASIVGVLFPSAAGTWLLLIPAAAVNTTVAVTNALLPILSKLDKVLAALQVKADDAADSVKLPWLDLLCSMTASVTLAGSRAALTGEPLSPEEQAPLTQTWLSSKLFRNALESTGAADDDNENLAPVSPPAAMRRTISTGDTPVIDTVTKSQFLQQIVEAEKNTLGGILVKHLLQRSKSNASLEVGGKSARRAQFATFAALLKHEGMVVEAIAFARLVRQDKAQRAGQDLLDVWRMTKGVPLHIMQQHNATHKAVTTIADEVVEKARFLLRLRPVCDSAVSSVTDTSAAVPPPAPSGWARLRRQMSDDTGLRKTQLLARTLSRWKVRSATNPEDRAIDSILAFIKSPVTVPSLEAVLARREARATQRVAGLHAFAMCIGYRLQSPDAWNQLFWSLVTSLNSVYAGPAGAAGIVRHLEGCDPTKVRACTRAFVDLLNGLALAAVGYLEQVVTLSAEDSTRCMHVLRALTLPLTFGDRDVIAAQGQFLTTLRNAVRAKWSHKASVADSAAHGSTSPAPGADEEKVLEATPRIHMPTAIQEDNEEAESPMIADEDEDVNGFDGSATDSSGSDSGNESETGFSAAASVQGVPDNVARIRSGIMPAALAAVGRPRPAAPAMSRQSSSATEERSTRRRRSSAGSLTSVPGSPTGSIASSDSSSVGSSAARDDVNAEMWVVPRMAFTAPHATQSVPESWLAVPTPIAYVEAFVGLDAESWESGLLGFVSVANFDESGGLTGTSMVVAATANSLTFTGPVSSIDSNRFGSDASDVWAAGDVVGVGINFAKRTAFVTRNGVLLPNTVQDIAADAVVPIMLNTPICRMCTGPDFKFDLDAYARATGVLSSTKPEGRVASAATSLFLYFGHVLLPSGPSNARNLESANAYWTQVEALVTDAVPLLSQTSASEGDDINMVQSDIADVLAICRSYPLNVSAGQGDIPAAVLRTFATDTDRRLSLLRQLAKITKGVNCRLAAQVALDLLTCLVYPTVSTVIGLTSDAVAAHVRFWLQLAGSRLLPLASKPYVFGPTALPPTTDKCGVGAVAADLAAGGAAILAALQRLMGTAAEPSLLAELHSGLTLLATQAGNLASGIPLAAVQARDDGRGLVQGIAALWLAAAGGSPASVVPGSLVTVTGERGVVMCVRPFTGEAVALLDPVLRCLPSMSSRVTCFAVVPTRKLEVHSTPFTFASSDTSVAALASIVRAASVPSVANPTSAEACIVATLQHKALQAAIGWSAADAGVASRIASSSLFTAASALAATVTASGPLQLEAAATQAVAIAHRVAESVHAITASAVDSIRVGAESWATGVTTDGSAERADGEILAIATMISDSPQRGQGSVTTQQACRVGLGFHAVARISATTGELEGSPAVPSVTFRLLNAAASAEVPVSAEFTLTADTVSVALRVRQCAGTASGSGSLSTAVLDEQPHAFGLRWSSSGELVAQVDGHDVAQVRADPTLIPNLRGGATKLQIAAACGTPVVALHAASIQVTSGSLRKGLPTVALPAAESSEDATGDVADAVAAAGVPAVTDTPLPFVVLGVDGPSVKKADLTAVARDAQGSVSVEWDDTLTVLVRPTATGKLWRLTVFGSTTSTVRALARGHVGDPVVDPAVTRAAQGNSDIDGLVTLTADASGNLVAQWEPTVTAESVVLLFAGSGSVRNISLRASADAEASAAAGAVSTRICGPPTALTVADPFSASTELAPLFAVDENTVVFGQAPSSSFPSVQDLGRRVVHLQGTLQANSRSGSTPPALPIQLALHPAPGAVNGKSVPGVLRLVGVLSSQASSSARQVWKTEPIGPDIVVRDNGLEVTRTNSFGYGNQYGAATITAPTYVHFRIVSNEGSHLFIGVVTPNIMDRDTRLSAVPNTWVMQADSYLYSNTNHIGNGFRFESGVEFGLFVEPGRAVSYIREGRVAGTMPGIPSEVKLGICFGGSGQVVRIVPDAPVPACVSVGGASRATTLRGVYTAPADPSAQGILELTHESPLNAGMQPVPPNNYQLRLSSPEGQGGIRAVGSYKATSGDEAGVLQLDACPELPVSSLALVSDLDALPPSTLAVPLTAGWLHAVWGMSPGAAAAAAVADAEHAATAAAASGSAHGGSSGVFAAIGGFFGRRKAAAPAPAPAPVADVPEVKDDAKSDDEATPAPTWPALSWSNGRMGPDIRNLSAVQITRVEQSGWGCGVAEPAVTAKRYVEFILDSHSGNYIYMGVVGQNWDGWSSSLSCSSAWTVNSDGKLLVEGNVAGDMGALQVSDRIGMWVEPGSQIKWYKNGTFIAATPCSGTSLRVAACFGGSNQKVTLNNSAATPKPEPLPQIMNGRAPKWQEKARSGAGLSNENRTAAWARGDHVVQVCDTTFRSGEHNITFNVVQSSGTWSLGLVPWRFVKAQNFAEPPTQAWSVHSSGAISQPDGRGSQATALAAGVEVGFAINMNNRTAVVSINGAPAFTWEGLDPRGVTPYVHFTASNQSVCIARNPASLLLAYSTQRGFPIADVLVSATSAVAGFKAAGAEGPEAVTLQTGRRKTASPGSLRRCLFTRAVYDAPSSVVVPPGAGITATSTGFTKETASAEPVAAIAPVPLLLDSLVGTSAAADPDRVGVSYFEVRLTFSAACDVCVGVVDATFPHSGSRVGAFGASVGLASGQWLSSVRDATISLQAPAFATDAVVGVGAQKDTGDLFFTLNGALVGVAVRGATLSRALNNNPMLFPAVSVAQPCQVQFNFGAEPFVADLAALETTLLETTTTAAATEAAGRPAEPPIELFPEDGDGASAGGNVSSNLSGVRAGTVCVTTASVANTQPGEATWANGIPTWDLAALPVTLLEDISSGNGVTAVNAFHVASRGWQRMSIPAPLLRRLTPAEAANVAVFGGASAESDTAEVVTLGVRARNAAVVEARRLLLQLSSQVTAGEQNSSVHHLVKLCFALVNNSGTSGDARALSSALGRMVAQVLALNDTQGQALMAFACKGLEDAALNDVDTDAEVAAEPIEPVRVLESDHPYNNNEHQEHRIQFPGARSITVTFSPQCSTEPNYDTLFITGSDGQTRNFSGSGWSGFEMPGDNCVVRFTSDGSNVAWGFHVTLTANGMPPGAKLSSADSGLSDARALRPSAAFCMWLLETVVSLPAGAVPSHVLHMVLSKSMLGSLIALLTKPTVAADVRTRALGLLRVLFERLRDPAFADARPEATQLARWRAGLLRVDANAEDVWRRPLVQACVEVGIAIRGLEAILAEAAEAAQAAAAAAEAAPSTDGVEETKGEPEVEAGSKVDEEDDDDEDGQVLDEALIARIAALATTPSLDVCWATDRYGPDIQVSNANKSVTRTNSSGWGCQLSTPFFNQGVVELVLEIQSSGTYLFIGVAGREFSEFSSTLRQSSTVCMQADGDLYVRSEPTARRNPEKMLLVTGAVLTMIIDIPQRQLSLSVNGCPPEVLPNIPPECCLAVCFGGDNQVVTIRSGRWLAGAPAGGAARAAAAPVAVGSLPLAWDQNRYGQDISIRDGGAVVTRTNSNGWGTAVTTPWINSGVVEVTLDCVSNDGTYLYVGVAGRSITDLSSSVRTNGSVVMQADGDLYVNGNSVARTTQQMRINTGSVVVMTIDMNAHTIRFAVDGAPGETLTGVASEVCVAACFGGSGQVVRIRSARVLGAGVPGAAAAAPMSTNPGALVWNRSMVGPDISFLSDTAVTRTNSAAWGIQTASQWFTSGVHTVDLEITRSSGTYLFVGVAARNINAGATLRQGGCACVQADGDMYVNEGAAPRSSTERLTMNTGDRVRMVIDMGTRSLTISKASTTITEVITGFASEVAVAVCFGGSDQVVTLLGYSAGNAAGSVGASSGSSSSAAQGELVEGESVPCVWDASNLGPNISLSEDNRRVTRTDSSGWGIQLSSPWVSSGIVRVVLEVVAHQGNYLYVGAASRSVSLGSSLRQSGAACMQADGDLYQGSDGFSRTRNRVNLVAGSVVTVTLNMVNHTVSLYVDGMGGAEVIPFTASEAAVAVCFGSLDQHIRIRSAHIMNAAGTAGASSSVASDLTAVEEVACAWDASNLGPNIALSEDNRRVTRTDSSGWGIQFATPWITSGIVRVVLEIAAHTGNYLFVGATSRAVTLSGSMRQQGCCCMQADGDLYRGADSHARSRNRVNLSSGSVVEVTINMDAHTLSLYVDGMGGPEVIPFQYSEGAVAVCFGGSDQFVRIRSAHRMAAATAAATSAPAAAPAAAAQLVAGAPIDLRWDSASFGPSISLSNGNQRVTRTDSSGWGCQLATPWISSGIVRVELLVEQNSGTYLYVGVAGRSCQLGASLRQSGAACMQADGDLYVGSDSFSRTCNVARLPSGTRVVMIINMQNRTLGLQVDGMGGTEVLPISEPEVAVAVCFGGDSQFVQILSAVAVSAEGGAAAAAPAAVSSAAGSAASALVTSGVGRAIDMRWLADRPGADMRFMDDNHSVTRVNSDGWGIQLATPRLTSGIVRVVLEVVQNSGSYLFVGVAGPSADVYGSSASLRQVNTVCMQSDGDLYVNGDSTPREHERMVLSSGSVVVMVVDMTAHTLYLSKDGGPSERLHPVPEDAAVAVCFGGSDQKVRIVSVEEVDSLTAALAAGSAQAAAAPASGGIPLGEEIAFTWEPEFPALNCEFSDGCSTVTRTEAADFACQIGSQWFSTGIHAFTFEVSTSSDSLLMGVVSRTVDIYASMRQAGCVCVDATGQAFVNGQEAPRTAVRLASGTVVTMVLDMNAHVLHVSTDGVHFEPLPGVAEEVTVAACFGGANQSVKIQRAHHVRDGFDMPRDLSAGSAAAGAGAAAVPATSAAAVAAAPAATAVSLEWNTSMAGPDIVVSNNGKTVTRTNSAGWGTILATPAITEGVVTVELNVRSNDGNCLFFGVAAAGISLGSALRQSRTACLQADGDVYVDSNTAGARNTALAIPSGGGMLTMIVNAAARTLTLRRNGAEAVLNGVTLPAHVAVCFGGTGQVVEIASASFSSTAATPVATGAAAGQAASMNWDNSRLGPDISLSNGNTTVTRTNSSGWGIQPATPWITSGTWEVTLRIDRNESAYLFIGLMARSVTDLSSTLARAGSYSLQANGDMYSNGSVQNRVPGNPFASGNTVVMVINMSAHTLTFSVNGAPAQGVTGVESEVCVAACFGGSDQLVTITSVRILDGAGVAAGGASAVGAGGAAAAPEPSLSDILHTGLRALSLLRSRRQESFNELIKLVGPNVLTQVNGEYPLTMRSGSVGLAADGLTVGGDGGGVAAALPLAVAGGKWFFSLRVLVPGELLWGWCTLDTAKNMPRGYALGGDSNSFAAGNGQATVRGSSTPLQHSAALVAGDVVGAAMDVPARTVTFVINGMVVFTGTWEGVSSEAQFVPAVKLSKGCAVFTRLDCSRIPSVVSDYQPIMQARATPWMTMRVAKRELAATWDWDESKDAQLVVAVNQALWSAHKSLRELPISTILAGMATGNATQAGRMLLRAALLSAVNAMVAPLLPFVNLPAATAVALAAAQDGVPLFKAVQSQVGSLAAHVVCSRHLLFADTKVALLTKVLDATVGSPSEDSRVELGVNRMMATRAGAKENATEAQIAATLFGQVMEGLRNAPPKRLRLRNRAFRLNFIGEGSIDAGGPYNEGISQMCVEMMTPALPLFTKTPNNLGHRGSDQDRFVPRVSSNSPFHMRMYRFAGQLMGIALRTGKPLDLSLAPLVWKRLVGEPVFLADVAAVDSLIGDMFKALDPESLAASGPIGVMDVDGNDTGIVLGAGDAPVTHEEVEKFKAKVLAFKAAEFDKQIDAIREGIASIVPSFVISLVSGCELEHMVCGSSTVDIALLKSTTQYTDGYSESTSCVRLFWEVLTEDFTNDERVQFLRFVSGRSRLPNTEAEMRRDNSHLVIGTLSCGNPNAFLPASHTCFFKLDLPAYTSREMMGSKLRYAIRFCNAIDTDNSSADASAWTAADESDTEA